MKALPWILVALSCRLASAATLPQGSSELRLSGGFDHLDLRHEGETLATLQTASLNLGWGYAVSDALMPGVTLGLAYYSYDPAVQGSYSTLGARITADLLYHFRPTGSTIPFGQLSLGATGWGGDMGGEQRVTWTLPRAGLGLRVPVGDSATIFGVAAFEYQIDAQGNEGIRGRSFLLEFGVSLIPGGVR